MSKTSPPANASPSAWLQLYPLLCGAFLGLALMKFGNPIILDGVAAPPEGWMEIFFQTWPAVWGYVLLVPLVVVGLPLMRIPQSLPKWLLWLPAAWLAWQFLSAAQTVSPRLTGMTLPHFVGCVACFYVGVMILGRAPRAHILWYGLILGFFLILLKGFNQHHGELEATRKYLKETGAWDRMHPDMIARLGSERIFSHFLYPNAFAGSILLLLPGGIYALAMMSTRWPRVVRGVLMGLLAFVGMACLYWTGSKAGWLIAVLMMAVILLQWPMSKTIKVSLAVVVLVVGCAGFAIKYQGYLQKGATSLGARFDYWRAAAQVVKARPLLGSGPGTFQVPYQQLKPPEAEMAKLAHNDYVQQASDSGVVGFVTYLALIVGALVLLYRKRRFQDGFFMAIWLGLLGLAVQGTMEFWLYIPGLAWTFFMLLGFLLGTPVETDESTLAEMKSTTAAKMT